MPDDDKPWVLVTGGAGFIGSHTVDLLMGLGRRVVVLDNFSTGHRDNLCRWTAHAALRVVDADICDGLFAPLQRALGRVPRVETIIHLAAQTSVVNSLVNPLADIRNNYVGTVHVLEFAHACEVRNIVFASSSAVYSDCNRFPIAEEDATLPVSTYAINKLAGEYLVRLYHAHHRVPATILRFFNVYGPRQRPQSPYSGVISLFCRNALRGEPLTVDGDGTQTRDFVFVTDVAAAIWRACVEPAARGGIFNVGSGSETAIRDLATAVIAAARSRSEIRHGTARPGSVHRSLADIGHARRVLGHLPRVDLATGLAATVDWSAEAERPLPLLAAERITAGHPVPADSRAA